MTGLDELAGQPDLITMDGPQRLVLDRMSPDLGYPFRDIASDCGLTLHEVRGIVHQFHSLGMTGYGPLYSDDGPGICGKGYWLSRRGSDLQDQFRRSMGWQALWAMRDAAAITSARSEERERG